MPTRRTILRTLALSALFGKTLPATAAISTAAKAVVFDAFPIFDPRPLSAMAEEFFPGHGAALAQAWRARQFDYAWLSSLAGRYRDFLALTDAALVAAAAELKLDLAEGRRRALVGAYLNLKAWPDVPPVLAALRQAGIRTAILSNFSPAMLDGCLAASGLKGQFDHVLSTDRAKTYKPDPRAYALAVRALGLHKRGIVFVPFASWDAFGAKAYGYPTFWNNRGGQVPDGIGPAADGESAKLGDLLRFVGVG